MVTKNACLKDNATVISLQFHSQLCLSRLSTFQSAWSRQPCTLIRSRVLCKSKNPKCDCSDNLYASCLSYLSSLQSMLCRLGKVLWNRELLQPGGVTSWQQNSLVDNSSSSQNLHMTECHNNIMIVQTVHNSVSLHVNCPGLD